MAKKVKKNRIFEYNKKYGDEPDTLKERLFKLADKLKKKDLIELPNAIKALRSATWSEITFVIYLVPKATPRPRYSSQTKRFYVTEAGENSKMFGDFMKQIHIDYEDLPKIDKITTACEYNIIGYLPTHNTMKPLERFLAELQLIKPIVTPDFDNMAKTYADMIQGHLLVNDSLIFKSSITKAFSIKPRVEFTIKYMDKFDCKYNKKRIEGWKYYADYEGETKDSIVES